VTARPRNSRVPNWVYRFYDADHRLLYVGMTMMIGERLLAHRRLRWWMRERVTFCYLLEYPTPGRAERAERKAIATELPLFNDTHLPRDVLRRYRDVDRPAYEALWRPEAA
jgi:hypothetical protein